ncbi:OmpA family protein [Rhizobium sp. KVB221]|uniref:OmpA family protein n=1 Tax=Rhizobium setariae TaxID=2801340 RepID=A0A936YTU9_9HYPH|nr:OmpA family protein [Rhizobium setariae]MBL0374852.1 OmpA family protein [Rhizobium setariae]
MAFKHKLLATAAIPVIALAWMGPASATGMVRMDAPFEVQSQVIKVQSDEEELLKQQRKERQEQRQEQRREKRNNQENAGQGDSEPVQPRRQKQQMQEQQAEEPVRPRRQKQLEAEQPQMQDQQQSEEPVKPRRKKQQDAEQQQMQEQQQQSEEPVKPRRKKQQEAEQQQMQEQQQQGEEPVKPRRKKQQDAEQQQMQEQQQQGEEPVKPRRKKQQEAEQQQMQEQQQQGEEPVKPRRKKQQDAEQQDNANGSIEEIQTPKRNKNKAEQTGDYQKIDRAAEDKPERVKERKKIAEDPSKSTDTIVLPVEKGAAVLDSDKDADNRGGLKERERRKREREEVKPVRVPKSDRDAQAGLKNDNGKPIRIRPVLSEKGERITGFKGYDNDNGRRVGRKDDDFRVIINIDGRVVVRDDDRGRLSRHGKIRYERLNNGLIREVVVRPNGDRIVTVRNRWGEIVRRSRIDGRHREVVIFYAPLLERGRDRLYMRDPGASLPPMRLRVPVREYIADVSSEPDRDYEEFLAQPPVEPVERVYSVDEVKYSARIRDKVRRIDLDTITFETGSAEVDMGQASSLRRVAAAMKDILDRDPGETFLIEGHTDAIGSDESNLVLSDERAESVANVLSDLFDIPAENLVTQGYGERFLKVDTDEAERMNRRVTIRRITSLVRPVESANDEQGDDQQYDDQQGDDQQGEDQQYDDQQ